MQMPRNSFWAVLWLCILGTLPPGPAGAQTYLTQWGSSGSGNGQFNIPQGVATDTPGNVYVADFGNHRIQKFTGTGTYLTQWGSIGSANGQFYFPQGVTIDGAGDVYVADRGNHRIQKFTSSGTYLSQWGSLGSGNGQFNAPRGVATDAAGDVYVVDASNNRMQKFTSTGTYLTQWGSLGSGNGQFNDPYGVATGSAGAVYIADRGNNRIQKFTGTGTYVTEWGSTGSGNGQFNSPLAVATDAAGNVYVADNANHRIQKFTSTGTYLGQWGSLGSGNGQFSETRGVGTNAAGNVYVTDQNNSRIQKFISNSYQVVIDANATWSQAQTAAGLAGGYLVTISSAAEQAMVEAAIAAASPPPNGGFWINLKKTGDCRYTWDNGETTCYGNFYSHRPNSGFSGEDRGQMMWSSDLTRRGRWNDVPAAGYAGTFDISRLGYIIEIGPLDPLGPCGSGVPVHTASACNQPPSGAIIVRTQLAGIATGNGVLTRTITDVSVPPVGPSGLRPASVLATYVVTVPIPDGATASTIATALRDSINRQAGPSFVASLYTGNESVQMYRASGNYTSGDNNTAPGVTATNLGTGVGPGLSGVGYVVLMLALMLLGGVALRSRRDALRAHPPQHRA